MDVAEDGGNFAGEGGGPGGGDVVEGGVCLGGEFGVITSTDVKPNGGYFGEG